MKTKIEKLTLKQFENYRVDNNQLTNISGGDTTSLCTQRLNGDRFYDTFNNDSKLPNGGWAHGDLMMETGNVGSNNSCPPKSFVTSTVGFGTIGLASSQIGVGSNLIF
ncbi:MAG: hypothetical protein ACK504_07820 [Bacteroidota bacterium]|jgi:hypothetical protein